MFISRDAKYCLSQPGRLVKWTKVLALAVGTISGTRACHRARRLAHFTNSRPRVRSVSSRQEGGARGVRPSQQSPVSLVETGTRKLPALYPALAASMKARLRRR